LTSESVIIRGPHEAWQCEGIVVESSHPRQEKKITTHKERVCHSHTIEFPDLLIIMSLDFY